MPVDLDLLVSLLKTTKNGCTLFETVKKDVKVASSTLMNLIRKLQSEKVINLDGNFIQADASVRMQIAVRALLLGADIENIARLLQWQEFEEIAAVVLEHNGYIVRRNLRFKQGSRRREIDVVACRKPIVICVDCKHWHRALSPSSVKKIVEAQGERTKALAESMPNVALRLACQTWGKAKFIPVILALLPSGLKFYNEVPIVPVLQLQDFVNQLPAHIMTLENVQRTFNHLEGD